MKPTSHNASPISRLPQRQRGYRRVAALLESAENVFSEKGYDAATMTEIALRAGSSIGSLYQFFPTKDLLANALLLQYSKSLFQRFDALEDEAKSMSLEKLATRLFRMLIDFRADHPAMEVLIEAKRIPADQTVKIRNRLRRYITDILKHRGATRKIAVLEPVAAAILQVMKSAAAINAEPDLPSRKIVLDELRTMLLLYMSDHMTH
jgi:AcrR family transcriptional regulator